MTISRMLAEFHDAIGDLGHSRTEWAELRKRLLREELEEVIQALDSGDMVSLAQELADLVYVAYGTAVDPGINLDVAIAEVHCANMSKIGPDGRFVIRPDGKVLKGPDYRPPDMSAAVNERKHV
jgi:predicted HAD superfamily Cof-like phosphohydrolase